MYDLEVMALPASIDAHWERDDGWPDRRSSTSRVRSVATRRAVTSLAIGRAAAHPRHSSRFAGMFEQSRLDHLAVAVKPVSPRWTWRAAAVLVLAGACIALPGLAVSHARQTRGSSAGVLRVGERVLPSHSVYFEGAVELLTLHRASTGRLVLRQRFAMGRIALSRRLAPGSYRVASWTQTCSGTCDHLDPPSYRCQRTVRVSSGSTRRVTVLSKVGARCRLAVPATP
jgi:hypothetical protein